MRIDEEVFHLFSVPGGAGAVGIAHAMGFADELVRLAFLEDKDVTLWCFAWNTFYLIDGFLAEAGKEALGGEVAKHLGRDADREDSTILKETVCA